ncbi:MAG: HD domain-containing phosphohydrolase [Gammaproteobacteria bacterium]
MKPPSSSSLPVGPTASAVGQEAIARLAAVVAGSDSAIIFEEIQGVITAWNPGAEIIFGYTAQEVIGKSSELLLPPERLQEASLILNKILNGERVRYLETIRVRKDGRHISVSTTASPIFDPNGKVIGVSNIAWDITSQITTQQALVIANQELAFQNEEKAKRAAELVIANQELAFQNEEKAKRAAELVIANQEMAFQNEEKAKRAVQLVILNVKLQESLMQTIELAKQLVELRDPYTAGHEQHVGDLARAIAEQLGFDKHRQQGLMIAGHLHDIGKIIVPIEILSKPGPISPEEYSLVKNHVQAGYKLLEAVVFPWPIARPVLEHHERLDGSGYPNHLKGDQISIEGRILSVADVVEAISSHRPYRPALGIDRALAEIVRGRGVLYDETVVDACLKLFRELGYKIAKAVA